MMPGDDLLEKALAYARTAPAWLSRRCTIALAQRHYLRGSGNRLRPAETAATDARRRGNVVA
jgi:hypothetical protein